LPTCGTRRPARALPWLAWTLSVDTWDTDWTEERKRAITAGAIAAQRRKGSVAVVREACAPSTNASNWSRPIRPFSPCLYRAPAGAGPTMTDRRRGRSGGDRQPDRGGPVPRGAGALAAQSGDRAGPCRPRRGRGAARAALYRRMRAGPDATGINWAGLLTNEMGEPLADDSGQFIDGSG
jgi:hypothetical protein